VSLLDAAFSVSATACMTALRAILEISTITMTHNTSPPMITRSCRCAVRALPPAIPGHMLSGVTEVDLDCQVGCQGEAPNPENRTPVAPSR